MIRVVIVNTQNETTNIYDFREDTLALKYVTKLYHIPPQSRFMIPVTVEEYFDSNKYIVNEISDMIGAMIPSDRETMIKWSRYPTYYCIRKEKD